MRYLKTLFLFGFASSAGAQDLPVTLLTPLACSGMDPEWSIFMDVTQANFSYRGRSDMTIMLETSAEGADWPRAYTLIGRGDSAILIVEPNACETGSYSARVLTQRGETPVLLTGCCTFLQG